MLTFSPRADQSCSTQLAPQFYTNWSTLNPTESVQRHNMGTLELQGPSNQWIEANMTPEPSRTAQQAALLQASDQYIAELHAASHVLIAMPMFNFSVPWHFKTYIDCIVRVGKTFSFSPEHGFGPMLSAKKKLLVVWSSAGSYLPEEAMATFDLLSPYVRQIFGFMGVTDMLFVAAGQQWGPPEQARAQVQLAHARLSEIATTW